MTDEDLTIERDQLRKALEKAIPIVADRVHHLRAENDLRALQMTNDLAYMKDALWRVSDE